MISDDGRMEFAPGMTIADRFELLCPLSKGTMGSLWVAHHKNLDVDVALKFIDPDLLHRSDLRSRFAQEAMAAARIRSPYVVSVLDFGEAEGNQPYIAMELLQGESLAERLEREKRLSIAETKRVLVHACKGLSKAHAQGIVHRDLKPENLFLAEDEEEAGFTLKVLDFGIAKASAPTTGILHRTMTGQLVGTPLYMSPEQAVGQSSSPRSDLYSIASVAYHCLSGQPVFEVANIALLLINLATRDPQPLRELVEDAPEELETWFFKALHKEPEQRFGSARELAESFIAACRGSDRSSLPSFTSLPQRSDPRSHDSWGEEEPPPAPHFSDPTAIMTGMTGKSDNPARISDPGQPPQALPLPVADSPPAVRSEMGDTLMDAAMAQSESAIPTEDVEKVRVIDIDVPSDPPAPEDMELGFAPTVKDQSGSLRYAMAQVSESDAVLENSFRKPSTIPPKTPPSPPSVDSAINTETLIWVLGSVLAIGIAVAIGWIIGRNL